MRQKWVFNTESSVSATPAVVNNIVYVPDYSGNLYAINANTGTLIWTHKLQEWTGIANDYARTDPAIYNGMVILGDQGGRLSNWNGSQLSGPGARVMAVDAATGGKVLWNTQVDAFPGAIVTSSPVIYDGVVYVGVASAEEQLASDPSYPCCTFRGSVVALDALSGAKLWQAFMVPDNHGKPGGYAGGGVWGTTPAIDAKRNSVYVGTGNNYAVPAAVKACIKATPGNANCTAGNDYFDAVVAMDLDTGAVKWASRALAYDAWNLACFKVAAGVGNCPSPEGPDYDFGGAGPNLLTVSTGFSLFGLLNPFNSRDIVGIGEKSGVYYALDPDDGSSVWSTPVGPGNAFGGIEWGTATDGNLIYVPISNAGNVTYKLQPSGPLANSGSWAGLDPTSGRIVWQTPTPGHCTQPSSGVTQGCPAFGPASVANGVLFVGSMDYLNPGNPTMFALNAATGQILWSFVPGSTVNSAPAIVGNSIYWGAGYSGIDGTSNNKVFAFSVN